MARQHDSLDQNGFTGQQHVDEPCPRGGSLVGGILSETVLHRVDEGDAGESNDPSSNDVSEGDDTSSTRSGSENEMSGGEGDRNGGAKKKKKKKKKKAKKDGETGQLESSSNDHMLPADVADARYATALEGLRSNDETCLWVQLSKCRLGDKKARKLADAINENRTVTSIDLSDNSITDEGIQQLTTVLSSGAAPDLIQLDLRGNQITEKGRLVLTGLQKIRKVVKVDIMENIDGSDNPKLDIWNEALPKNSWTSDANGWGGEVGGRNAVKEKLRAGQPQERVDAALKAIKESQHTLHVMELSNHLDDVMTVVVQELQEEQHKTYAATTIESLPQGLKLVTRNLPKFLSILDLCPSPIDCQRNLTEAAVGRHRIATVELLYRLSIPCNRCIDEQMVTTNAVSQVLQMFFQFPWNNILHAAIYRFFLVILSRPGSPMATSLLDFSNGLLSFLAREGSSGCQVSAGRRLGHIGHVVQLSKLLLELSEKHPLLQEKLNCHSDWGMFVEKGGALEKLNKEQNGFLGGSKPEPDVPLTPASFESEQAETANSLEKLRHVYLMRSCGGSFKLPR